MLEPLRLKKTPYKSIIQGHWRRQLRRIVTRALSTSRYLISGHFTNFYIQLSMIASSVKTV